MVRAISSAIEKRAFLNNSKAIGSWMAVMSLSPSTAGASHFHYPISSITVRYSPFWDKMMAIGIIVIIQSVSQQRRARLALTLYRGSQGADCSTALMQGRPYHR